MPRIRPLLLLAALALAPCIALPGAVWSQPSSAQPALTLSGGASPVTLTQQALRAFPAVSLDVAFMTSKGEEQARYTGAALWPLLLSEGLIDPDAHKGLMRRIIVITGADGYTVVLSAGELAPEYGNTPVLLAYQRNGEPLAGNTLRLIVPGDRRGARNVTEIVRIDVKTVETTP